ncbi:hypothetical protein NDU88_003180 [Pleurodeles waltl]|uniref:Uncharacterized protein n=1 Tax=Pleurodeles waltl TaxID=8319 RepID=A0AAV7UEI1_PLEWA|nr:hypothetical protein NDU88_003180 [Pleurodeles waltl]
MIKQEESGERLPNISDRINLAEADPELQNSHVGGFKPSDYESRADITISAPKQAAEKCQPACAARFEDGAVSRATFT